MTTKTHIRSGLLLAAFLLSLVCFLVPVARVGAGETFSVRVLTIHYTAHNGRVREATVLLPSWYGPHRNPPIPLVIAPHGRGCNGKVNAEYWADLPARGGFAVVNPDGMGRRMGNYSYGFRGQIDDLARMPELTARALPWLRIDRDRIYALGSSMGGQETLLLVARHPDLLAGAVAMDSVTDLGRRYGELPNVACNARCVARFGTKYGYLLQAAMRSEVGGTPAQVPGAYAARSPMSLAREIAFSGVPLQIWWSKNDRIVTNQRGQSGRLLRVLKQLNASAPIVGYEGAWAHSTEMRADALLPVAVAGFGLLPTRYAAAVAAEQPSTMQLPAPFEV
jgi:pimeloyl-ACP methyl ester carboxylesterase